MANNCSYGSRGPSLRLAFVSCCAWLMLLRWWAAPALISSYPTFRPLPVGGIIAVLDERAAWDVALEAGRLPDCTSNAPMSSRPLTTRSKPGPRWSYEGGGVVRLASTLA